MNMNPTLVMGQALAWLDRQPEDRQPREHDRRYLNLRVYDATGAGYHFVAAHSAGRWYYQDAPDSDHYNRAEQADLDRAIERGARVQLCGVRGESFGVWRTWADFAAAVEAAGPDEASVA